MNESIIGKVSSIQTLGTLDGPGIRFVVFLQGCNLRCGCCHNPEAQPSDGGTEYSAEQIVQKAMRYREYFGREGGITLSGGEVLLQPTFARKIFELCHENAVNTCIDTSGSITGKDVEALLDVTDHVLLDIKYTDDEAYRRYAGCSLAKPLEFLGLVNERNIPTTVRQVIIPTLNDGAENIAALRAITQKFPCVVKTELLPFKKLCVTKYEKLGRKFPFEDIPEPAKELMDSLNKLL